MTVDNIGEYMFKTQALCSWFVNGKRETDTFELHTLVKIDRSGPRVMQVRVGRA